VRAIPDTDTRKGKLTAVAVIAIARELSAFIWAINREIAGQGQILTTLMHSQGLLALAANAVSAGRQRTSIVQQ